MGTFVSGPIAAVLTDPTGHQIGTSTPLPVNPAESGAVNMSASSSSPVTVSSASATLLAAARATRRAVLVTNEDAAITIRVGDATVTATTGHKLIAGASITIPFTGAVYGFAASGSPNASVTDLYD